jgi:uncharacterized protein (TIGR01777 family)
MKIAITGSSGFIGTSLLSGLYKTEMDFFPLKRNETDTVWAEKIGQCDVLINLAGAPVIQRWTPRNKNKILYSRINTTKRLVSILNELPRRNSPCLFISASAIGIYPSDEGRMYDEESNAIGDGFLPEVVVHWEKEALELTNRYVRLVIPRIGVVLGKDGGLIKKILPIFKLGLGGIIASGQQSVSFIHIDDLVQAFRFFIENKDTAGIYNLTAPEITSNRKLTKTMAEVLNRPAIVPVPAFALKLLYGKAAAIMINGEKVYPKHLLGAGFEFKFPDVETAVRDLLS